MPIQKPFAVMPLPLTNISTGNQRSNRPASHLGLPQYPGMVWQSNGNGSLFVRGQFNGATGRVNFASLMGTNAQAGTWWRVKIGTSQGDVDSATPSYDSGALPIITPARTRDDGRYHSHLEIPAVQSGTWWRIDVGNHTGDFLASALILGEKRTPARFYNRDRELGYEDLGALDIGRNGVVAETPGVVLKTMLFRLGWTTEEEWFSLWSPLVATKGKRQLIYFCFDPEATVRRQDKSLVGYLARDLFMRGGTAPQTNEVDFQFRGLL